MTSQSFENPIMLRSPADSINKWCCEIPSASHQGTLSFHGRDYVLVIENTSQEKLFNTVNKISHLSSVVLQQLETQLMKYDIGISYGRLSQILQEMENFSEESAKVAQVVMESDEITSVVEEMRRVGLNPQNLMHIDSYIRDLMSKKGLIPRFANFFMYSCAVLNQLFQKRQRHPCKENEGLYQQQVQKVKKLMDSLKPIIQGNLEIKQKGFTRLDDDYDKSLEFIKESFFILEKIFQIQVGAFQSRNSSEEYLAPILFDQRHPEFVQWRDCIFAELMQGPQNQYVITLGQRTETLDNAFISIFIQYSILIDSLPESFVETLRINLLKVAAELFEKPNRKPQYIGNEEKD